MPHHSYGRSDAAASSTQIAKAILPHDHSQVGYYEEITKRMVGRVLVKNCVVERQGSVFSLPGVADLSNDQREELIALCGGELTAFLARRGEKLFDHRRLCNSNIPGTIPYEVLKAAGFRCMLCGISTDDCFLDVDQIEPRQSQSCMEHVTRIVSFAHPQTPVRLRRAAWLTPCGIISQLRRFTH